MTTTAPTLTTRSSALAAVDHAWNLLTREPDPPLVLDCDVLAARWDVPAGTLPVRVWSLRGLRDWMLDHPDAHLARDVIWRETVTRARRGEPGWVIAAVGLAVPALVRCAGRLTAGYRGEAADIDAEILAGYLTALHGEDLDLTRPAVYARLCWAGWRAGRALRRADEAEVPSTDMDTTPGSRAPEVPWRHVDLLVHHARDLGLIASDDAESWIDVRLGGRSCYLIAEARGLNVDVLRMRLNRADRRIASALADGRLTGHAFPDAARTTNVASVQARTLTIGPRLATAA
ncbi:hypothetical protein AB0M43_38910 [Longispora sp. NPDC051575]|uniref:hypothetical protein n=1 Tax=Longispora sp. NPDC051575 TaxID=3154943 RepID=UPI003438F005